MFVKTLSYEEYAGHAKHWHLEKLSLGPVNLIVGQNSSGKTRAMNVISALARLIAGKITPSFDAGDWKADFERHKGQFAEPQHYEVKISNRAVVSEQFSIRNNSIMERSSDGNGFVLKKATSTRTRYKVPTDQLMAVVRRDEIQHPYFEHLHAWGRDACIYRFGSDFGKSTASLIAQAGTSEDRGLQMSEHVDNAAHVFRKTWERFSEAFAESVRKDMERLGYPLSEVALTNIPGVLIQSALPLILYVREKGLESLITQHEMSQGMYRALALIIHINANIFWGRSTKVGHASRPGDLPMVIIDDIGEGLDFERSKRLLKLLIDKATEHNFQLVMSSNDRFVMNDVPLEYWTVLHRTGGRVRAFNYTNSKAVFDEFRYLGLNNFDFFSGRHFLESTTE